MSYIDFEDLKDVLGYCLDCCGVDGDDINWVFSEIEQKCHIGKKPDGKKKKKSNKTEIDMILKRLAAVETQAFNQCVGKGAIDRIDSDIRNIREDIRRVKADIAAAKSMAEIAKRRTEVDYSKPKIT